MPFHLVSSYVMNFFFLHSLKFFRNHWLRGEAEGKGVISRLALGAHGLSPVPRGRPEQEGTGAFPSPLPSVVFLLLLPAHLQGHFFFLLPKVWGESLVRVLLKENWHLREAFARRLRIDGLAQRAAHKCLHLLLPSKHILGNWPETEPPGMGAAFPKFLCTWLWESSRPSGTQGPAPGSAVCAAKSLGRQEPLAPSVMFISTAWTSRVEEPWSQWGVLGQQDPPQHSQVILYRVLALSPISPSKESMEN